MKKIIPIILLVSFFCSSQTIEVNYFENNIIKNYEGLENLPQNLKIRYKQNFFSNTLTNNRKVSSYTNDSLIINFENKDEIIETHFMDEYGNLIFANGFSKAFDMTEKERLFYKDFKKNELFYHFKLDEKISVKDSLINWNWELSDETQEILGYKCKKAISNKYNLNIIAWYCAEIPINDGPNFFAGLPGLILKVTSKTHEIIAYNLNLNSEKMVPNKPSVVGKEYSIKELEKEIEIYNKKSDLDFSKEVKKDFSDLKKGDVLFRFKNE